MSEQIAQAPNGAVTKFCTACGRQVDARAEICPGCGVRQPDIAPVADQTATTTSGAPSVVAFLLAIAAAAIGSVGYVWVLAAEGITVDTRLVAFAAGFGVPLALTALLYVAKAVPGKLAAGVFLGIGLATFFGWLPNVLLAMDSSEILMVVWLMLGAGAMSMVAGVVAALQRSPTTS